MMDEADEGSARWEGVIKKRVQNEKAAKKTVQ
jgi:hypothetical protein